LIRGALLTFVGQILISGGADAKIIVWDTATATRLHTLRDNRDTMMAVQFLAIDPLDSTADELVLVSSSSDPDIRRWRISLDSASQIFDEKTGSKPSQADPSSRAIREHETSVYRLFFDSDEGDLWTASADGTVKCLSRTRNWAAEETIEHGDYVRTVVATTDWIVTAGRDEDVKVWDRTTGKLFHVYDGHFDEVTGLVLMDNSRKVVSVSIDGTLRTWPLDRNELVNAKVDRDEMATGLVKEAPVVKTSLMTEEEEAELAELMDDDS
jgi:WD40 repeat protein